MSKPRLLEKRFIIFQYYENNCHFVTSILCNPWFMIANNMKNRSKSGSQWTDTIANLDEFVHGWLMFDPMKGFLSDKDMTEDTYQQRNMFVWLMNLAALYHECSVEKTLMLLDYKMHLYLKPEEMNDWAKHFNKSKDFKIESE